MSDMEPSASLVILSLLRTSQVHMLPMLSVVWQQHFERRCSAMTDELSKSTHVSNSVVSAGYSS